MTVVREVMTEQLVTVEPSTSVAAAVTVMGIQRVGAVLVMDDARLEGIFTERDLVRALSYDIAAASQPVGQWMTRNPRSEEHTSELQSRRDLVCRLLLEKKKNT